jgi:hypothetical protein
MFHPHMTIFRQQSFFKESITLQSGVENRDKRLWEFVALNMQHPLPAKGWQ